MTNKEFNEIISTEVVGAKADMEADGMVFDDAVAFECARSLLDDHPGMEAYINKVYGASDAVGWLANKF